MTPPCETVTVSAHDLATAVDGPSVATTARQADHGPDQALQRWSGDPRLVWTTRLPGQAGERGATSLPEELWRPQAPDGLWNHQAEAIDLARARHHTVVATGTGSGKSLCYQLPIAECLLADPTATALVVQPTKALAHDQLQDVRRRWPELTAIAYDGDADVPTRQLARREAQLLFTNPEMLHSSINARHTAWSRLLGHLRFVVLDEIHAYRGVFGSHVAHVVRRLRRLSDHHGGSPTFICTSATISDAGGLASELVGADVRIVDRDTANSADRALAIWDPRRTSDHSSQVHDTAQLTAELIQAGHRTITFARARATTESIAELARRHVDRPRRLLAYRGGYLPAERRGIELAIASGDVDGVVTTSALELGVDIGELDAAVLHGFPGTLASFRQQIGRVGRRGQPSLALLVLGDDQLDGWIARHPDALVDRPSERVVVNPSNPTIGRPHLACAAHELPLDAQHDQRWWPDDLDALACDLARAGLVRVRNGRLAFADSTHPGRQIGLRSSDPRTIRIETSAGELVGTVDAAAAPTNVHAGARYVHQGVAYDVTELDLDARIAKVVSDRRGPCRSSTRSTTDVVVCEERTSFDHASLRVHQGTVRVSSQVTSYRVTDPRGQVIDSGPLELPPNELVTDAMWLTWPEAELLEQLEDPERVGGALHAAEHALIGILPLFAICDRWDVGGLSIARHPDTALPTVFIHEGTPGGAGLTRLAVEAIGELLETTRHHIDDCACEDGCPTCVVSPKCGNGNEPLDKAGAVLALDLGLVG